MASIANDPGGRKRILFTDGDGQRKAVRLGKVSNKDAESFRVWLERLVNAQLTNAPMDPKTAAWLADLPDATYRKLVRVGLAEDREAPIARTLDELMDAAFGAMQIKPSTRTRYSQTRQLLTEHFGEGRELDTIGNREADEWRAWLIGQEYAEAKVSKEIQIARMLFRSAARWGWVAANPFEGFRTGSQTNRARLYFLTPEDSHKLIDAAPDADWRCIIALARFGGLRCPSEVLRLGWADVDWDRARIRVTSPKTEGSGKGERFIPLFPELRTVLMDAFDLAPEGARFVVNGYRDAQAANLRTHLERIIGRAGLSPWPRLFNAMRASRATELAALYPAAVCTAWLGHTQAVATAHYHMVRDSDFERAAATPTGGAKSGADAAQNPAQQGAAESGEEQPERSQKQAGPALTPVPAACCHSLQEGESRRNWTRTSDLCHVTAAL